MGMWLSSHSKRNGPHVPTSNSSDLFAIILYEPLLPSSCDDAARYDPGGTLTLDRDSTVEDICDFVIQYIKSDVLVFRFHY